jgi:hypothetical protein
VGEFAGVGDFSLMDAIDCGIVKLAQVADSVGEHSGRYTQEWHAIALRAADWACSAPPVVRLERRGVVQRRIRRCVRHRVRLHRQTRRCVAQKPRATILVRAVRPDRDALEIRFPRVEGYRVELPQQWLDATFTEDSRFVLTPALVGASADGTGPISSCWRTTGRAGRTRST